MNGNHAFSAILLSLAALLTPGCKKDDEAPTRVAVIGSRMKVADPSSSVLSAGDQLLVANVAQGLVRFDARGQIEPGLAERWNVSDDGLSYVFRLRSAEWHDGSKLTAQQVARLLRRATNQEGRNPLRDSLGAVTEIVAMTDRVLELRLSAPRPNLLQLLAQPELAIIRGGGSGPFQLGEDTGEEGRLTLSREILVNDGDEVRKEEVELRHLPTREAVEAFARGDVDLVLGGTFADLPIARGVRHPRNALLFDPVAGLFGLVPVDSAGPLNEPDVRRLLTQAIDRDALIAALGVPNLAPRTTLLQTGLEGVPTLAAQPWFTRPLSDRRASLIAESNRLFGTDEKPSLRIGLPDGSGADLLFARLQADWGAIGLTVQRVGATDRADLRLVDAVAPSTSPSWFLRQFRCAVAPICSEDADALLDSARQAMVAEQRAAFFLQAGQVMDEQVLFFPLTAPIRWSLVSPAVQGFAGNRFARHTLTGLRTQLERSSSE
ncbi:ABC transporter substrate-binding protein [Sphingomonas piscis]|uniref:ABC transporter substrate-binding protein n=1 Tax=Sphingomonas piscis TaxID=2714943 RepID=A0A6G7YN57_9SPHN|nr:ABC transporter substrate-binding protein [Sphingomonas piscis]QIK78178.1 ABC transporter substrate-binding protein [Sphingomonas piscis]